MLSVPPLGEPRQSQPVAVSPCGTIFRLKGGILAMSFLDCNGALIPYSYESWKDEGKQSNTFYLKCYTFFSLFHTYLICITYFNLKLLFIAKTNRKLDTYCGFQDVNNRTQKT